MKTHGMKMRNDGKKKERTTKAAIMGLIAAVYLSAPAPGEDLGSTYGGKVTDGDANGFTATLDGDYRVNGVLIGGSSDNGNANDNAVDAKGKLELNGSLYGGYAPKGVANGNTVTLEGDMDLNVALYGGWGDKEANNNSVILKGDITINEDLFGAITSTGTANGNLVSLEGNITIVGNLRGGRSGSGLSSDNTLEIRSENIRVGGLYNFQNLNYYFSGTVKDGTIMVWVTDKANISGSTIQLFFSGEDGGLQPGEKIILIQTVYGITGIPANKDSQVTARVGVSLDYGQYDLTFDDPKNPKKLIASLHQEEDPDPQPDPEPAPDPSPTPDPDPDPTPSPEPNPTPASPTPVVPKVNPQLKSLLEGWLAGMTQLVRGGDLVAEAIDDAATAGSSENMAGGIPFAKINGNRLRHKTGSHIDTRGTNVVAGIAGGKSGEDGSALTGGVFLEYGRGNYDTWNTFADRDPVQGAGDTKYAGAGAMGRYDFKSKTDAHTYFEGSLRGGRIKVNYDSLTLKDAMGTVAAWHAETGYMSAHGAVGRTIKLSGAATLDVKAGYYWTRMNGAETRLTTGEKITYEEIDSHRARIAARLTGDSKLAVKPYAGIALEREFSGKARGSVYGYKIDPPTLKGTTFVADAGIQIKAGNKDNLTIELGVQAYAGRREGITGGAGFSYKF